MGNSKIWQASALGIVATLLTVPLTTYYFHQFPNTSWLQIFDLILAEIILFWNRFLCFSFIPGINWLLILGISIFALIQGGNINELPWAVSKGYHFSTSQVVGIYILICSLIVISFSELEEKIAFFITPLALIIFSLFSFNKFQNGNSSELVILNNSQLTILIKERQNVLCFYDRPKKLDKIKYQVNAYSKIHPGKVHYQNCKWYLDIQYWQE